jgi:hypothetical protein
MTDELADDKDTGPVTENPDGSLDVALNTPDDSDAVQEKEDGSLEVQLQPGSEVTDNADFYDNLADGVVDDLAGLATDLIDLTNDDVESHDDRVSMYRRAMDATGLTGAVRQKANFQGASDVVHPMLIKAIIDFQASVVPELMPIGGDDGGFVKHAIEGKTTQRKLDRAHRKSQYMNWQLRKLIPGFRDTMEEMLGQVPAAGRQYIKGYYDRAKNRPDFIFVPLFDLVLASSATTLTTADRYTHIQSLTEHRMQERIDSGMYIDFDLGSPIEPDKNDAQDAVDRTQGRLPSSMNKDNERLLREIYCYLDLDEDKVTGGKPAPYIVTIDDTTQKVIAIYRNWRRQDPTFQPLQHFSEFPFIPWIGGAIGLAQILDGLGRAATGSLNALLDAAHLANTQAALKMSRGGTKGGQSITINPGEIVEIEAPSNVDDVRKLAMPIPFPGPNATLFSLLGFVVEAGEGMVSVALEKIAEQRADIPVGTIQTLVEQGSKVYAAIHARLHEAMRRVLEILHQLNELWLDDQAVMGQVGEQMVTRADFQGPLDVSPVSDPLIFSEVQRQMQVQTVAQRASLMPMVYDLRKVEELILKGTKLPDATDLLVPKPEPKRLNHVNENLAAAQGGPIVVFPDQDHAAHMMSHIEFCLNPLYGMNPAIQPTLWPSMVQHIRDHLLYAYVQGVLDISNAHSDHPITKLMDEDPEVSKHMDALLAESNLRFLNGALKQMDTVMPPPPPPPPPVPMGGDPNQPQPGQPQPPMSALLSLFGQMMQFVQSIQPPTPMDPTQVAAQEVQQKGQLEGKKLDQAAADAQAKLAIEAKKADANQQLAQAQIQQNAIDGQREQRLEEMKAQKDMAIHHSDMATRHLMNTEDNSTAVGITQMELEHDAKTNISTGTGINPGAE